MDYRQHIVELQTKINNIRLSPCYLSKQELINSISKMSFFSIETFSLEIDFDKFDVFVGNCSSSYFDLYRGDKNIFKKTNRIGWYGLYVKIIKGNKLTRSRIECYRLEAITNMNNQQVKFYLYTDDYGKIWLMRRSRIN